MKIWTFSICFNESRILPFWLRHYEKFCDQMHVWDDHSTDGTRELLQAHPKVVLHDWEGGNGIDDQKFIEFAHETYPMARGKADWCIWCDMDEFIYHPDIKKLLEGTKSVDVFRTDGYNMVGNGLPVDDGRQIWEIHPMGVSAPVYGKPIVFRSTVKIRWNRGKHDIERQWCNPKISPSLPIKLLHYRYMGFDYTKERNARNYERCGLKSGDKGAAWSCAPNYNGEHSATWAHTSINRAFNVIQGR